MLRMVGAAVWLLALCVSAAAQRYESHKESLIGLGALDVVVSDIPDEIQRDGLYASQIKTDVELRLRRAGILVSKDATEYLHVTATIIKTSPARGYAYFVAVRLRQMVEMPNSRAKWVFVTTWEDGSLATVPLSDLRQVREDIVDFIDKFSNDYLEMNPKR